MSNQMNVTDLGILNINRKIIDNRKYQENLISNVGEVNIVDGVASSFNSSNYLYKDELLLSGNNISIIFSGTFLPLEETQCAWKLVGSDSTNVMSLLFIDHSVQLIINSELAVEFDRVPLEDVSTVRMITNISATQCEFILDVDNNVYQKTVNFSESFNFNDFDKIYLGNDPEEPEEYWRGAITLQNFEILQDESLVYSPSTGYPMSFSKIVVSDGQYPLTDNISSVPKHIYSFDIREVTRTNNTLLLSSVMDEKATLTIKEIGLYAETDDGEILFSKIDNLNINKGEGVPYDLIFTINLTINFLNVVGFPEDNDIVLGEYKPALLKDFITVKELLLYIVTNLERIIAKNAKDIGYNQAQVLYRLQQELEKEEECYFSIQTYSKLVKKFKEIVEMQFDSEAVNYVGDVEVGTYGESSNFSQENYLTASVNLNPEGDWEFDTSFNLRSNFGGKAKTIATLSNDNRDENLKLDITYEDTMVWGDPILSGALGAKYWSLIASDGTKFVLISSEGYISTSTDGDTWTAPKLGLPSGGYRGEWSAVAYHDKFVAVSLNGRTATSSDGETWEVKESLPGNYTNWTGITYFPTKSQFIALSDDGKLSTSSDGITWSTPTQNTNLKPHQNPYISYSWSQICYCNGFLVALSPYGYVSKSTNGTTWSSETTKKISTGTGWDSIATDGSKLIAFDSRSSNGASSTDGVTWTTFSSGSTFVSATFGNNTFIAITSNTRIGKSETGEIWTTASTANKFLTTHTWNNFTKGPEKYVAISTQGFLASSTNGSDWENLGAYLGQDSWKDIAYGNGTFVALNNRGYISTSTDGETWTEATQISNLGNHSWVSIIYNGTSFIALGDGGYVSTSSNGTDWIAAVRNTQLGSRRWISMATNGSYVVALGSSGYISTSENGETWTTAVQNTNLGSNSWQAITYGDNEFMALGQNGYISTSTDGTDWVSAEQNPNLSGYSYSWVSLIYSDETYLALNKNGYLATSSFHTSWSQAELKENIYEADSSSYWSSLTYGKDKYVAINYNNELTTSIDGSTWTDPVKRSEENWVSFVHDGTYLMALSKKGSLRYVNTLEIPESSDSEGNGWKDMNSDLGDSDWTFMAYVSNRYLALGDALAVSEDASSWSTFYPPDYKWVSASYDSEKYVLLSSDGSIGISVDGDSWDISNPLGDYNWKSLTYGNGKFVALSYYGYTSISEDGIEWSEPVANSELSTNKWTFINYCSNDKFVATSESGKFSTSPNGLNWSTLIDINNAKLPVTAASYGLVAEKISGQTVLNAKYIIMDSEGNILISSNGTSWTIQWDVKHSYWTCIFYDSNQYIAMNHSGGISTSPNLQDWTKTEQKIVPRVVPWNAMGYAGSSQGGITRFWAVNNEGFATEYRSFENYWTTAERIPNLGIHNWISIIPGMILSSDGYVSKITDGGSAWSKAVQSETLAPYTWVSMTYGAYGPYGYTHNFALSTDGYISRTLSSGDGTTWSTPVQIENTENTHNWKSIAANGSGHWNTIYVALSAEGYVGISDGGDTWTISQALPEEHEWVQVCDYDLGFLALSNDGYTAFLGYEATTWEIQENDLPQKDWNNLLKYGALRASSRDGYVATSKDGIHWTVTTQKFAIKTGNWRAMTADNNGTHVAISVNGFVTISGNGINWEPARYISNLETLSGDNWYSVVYGNGKFVAVSGGGYISTSTDGLEWTKATTYPVFSGIGCISASYGNGKFMILGSHSDYTKVTIMTSKDGVTWTTPETVPELTNTYPGYLAYNGERFAILGESGFTSRSLYTNYCTLKLGDFMDEPLFEVDENTKYYLKVEYDKGNNTYKVSVSRNGVIYTELYSQVSSETIGDSSVLYIGNSPSTNNPFDGTLSLLDWSLISGDNIWHPVKEVTVQDTQLLQYYHFPSPNYSSYSINDINNPNYIVDFLEERFVCYYKDNEGINTFKSDLIDFNYQRGLSLCMKVDLRDVSSKLIFAKTMLSGELYCSLSFIDKVLSFIIYTENGNIKLSKKVELNDIAKYTETSFLLSVIATKDLITMYRGNEEIAKYSSPYVARDGAPTYTLANYIQADVVNGNNNILKSICHETTGINYEPKLVELTQKTLANTENYLKDMIVIEGVLTPNNLYYITNLTDTNYKSRGNATS